MEVREFKAKDLKTLVKMLGKLTPEARRQIVEIFKTGDKKDIDLTGDKKDIDLQEVGISIFQVIATLTDDIYVWLADMAGMTAEQFDEMPASAPVEIIKVLVKRGDFRDFFTATSQS